MASDCHERTKNNKRSEQQGQEEGQEEEEPSLLSSSMSSLLVVTGNGLAASTSSIAPLVGAGVNEQSQQSRTNRATKSSSSSSSSASSATATATQSVNTNKLDIIGTSTAVKKLFSMSLDALSSPMTQQQQQQQQQQPSIQRKAKKPTLLAVHNFDGTLIIDDAEDESNYGLFQRSKDDINNDDDDDYNHNYNNIFYHDSLNPDNRYKEERISDTLRSATTLLPPSSQSLALALSPNTQAGVQSKDDQQLPLDALSIISNIVQQSTAVADNKNNNSSDQTTTTLSSSEINQNLLLEGRHQSSSQQQQQPSSSALLAPPKAPREYVRWQFQDLNMLLGHDTLVVRPPEGSSAKTTEAGGIAVRVEDAHFLRSVWEVFQRQQQQQQALLGTASASTRSYAQVLLQEHENNESPVSSGSSEELPSSTSAVVPASRDNSGDISNSPRGDVVNPNDGTEKDQSSSGFSEIPLQTCIVPFLGPLGGKMISPVDSSTSPLSTDPTKPTPQGSIPSSSMQNNSPALSIVLDAYLDNLMANVPQLALCLEEKGLIQSVKMLPTEEIPSMMLNPSTLDTSRPLDNPTDNRHHRRRSSGSKLEESIFSPQIMEMNAGALLRFLKTNCTRNHATYLLRHEDLETVAANGDRAGNSPPPQNIQLYDISSISTQKQKKWIWWLATMSYRFALRLRHLETMSSKDASSSASSSTSSSSSSSFPNRPGRVLSESQKRAIRDRQRSLFQQTLELLQDLMDIDGKAHESMVASVREHMADTYLSSVVSSNSSGDLAETTSAAAESAESRPPRKQSISEISASPSPPVVTATISATARAGSPPSQLPSFLPFSKDSSGSNSNNNNKNNNHHERHHRQPYATVSVDALNKAQDHLVRGIKILSTLFERDIEERRVHRKTKKLEEEAAWKRSRRRQRTERRSVEADSKSKDQEEMEDECIPRLSPAIVLQLFGMNFKLVNISLRLAEHHLGNYYSSSAMQALRTAARRLNDAAHLLDYCSVGTTTATTTTTTKDSIIENKNEGRTLWSEEDEKRHESLQLQYIWLLEHCGHFARSFASDELWRDRGHASGEDVISVLSDVETVFAESRMHIGGRDDEEEIEMEKSESRFWKMVKMDVLLEKSKGKISLQSVSGIVAPFKMKTNQIENAIEAAKAVLGKENVLRRERRKVLVASCVLYSRAITAFQFTVQLGDHPTDQQQQTPEKVVLLNLLRQRLGDACNETGKVLLAALRTLLVNNQGSKTKSIESRLAAEALLDSAEFWFTLGLEAFYACKDTRNLALLRCNICQSYKLRANSGFSKSDDSSSTSTSSSSKHAEECLQQAADELLTAHEDLGQRDADPHTWDMVSEELAATFLVLGVRRRQSLLGSGNAPVIFQVMRLSPGEERSIVDPIERALKIYEQSDNAHQAAAVHYQLALTFSKLWTCQLNESNTRKKLSKAFEHYKSAFNFFSTHSRGNEPTFCLLCLDLASLYAAIPGEEGLMKSLGCCLDCCDTFSVEAITVSTSLSSSTVKSMADWHQNMATIAKSVDDRVFKLLRSLVKVDPVRYKDMYREGLAAKMVRNVPEEHEDFDRNLGSSTLLALHEVLLAVKKMYGVIISK